MWDGYGLWRRSVVGVGTVPGVRRVGDAPPPGCVVFREGKRKPTTKVQEEADDEAIERGEQDMWDGFYRLSVFAAPLLPGESEDEAVGRLFGAHRKVKFYRTTSVPTLQDAGFELEASPPEPYHYDVLLGTKLAADIVEQFEGCFGEPRRNPAWHG